MLLSAVPALGQAVTLTRYIETVVPDPNFVGASPSTVVAVTMTSMVDASTVSASSVRVFGRWSGPSEGSLSVANDGGQIRFVPAAPFFAGELVTVALSDSIRFRDGGRLEGGFAWHFWIRSNPATPDVTEVARIPIRKAGETLIQSYGAHAGDFNDDGWSDLVIPNEQSRDLRLFINRSGSYFDFDVYPLPFSIVPSTNEGADFNRDGYLDLAVGSGGNENVYVALGDGAGSLNVQTPIDAGGNVRGLCVLDVDTDGDDDIVTASRATSTIYLLINDGFGSFRNPIPLDGHGDLETACAVGDANGDGVMDLFVGSLTSRTVGLFVGNASGELIFTGNVTTGGGPWMLASGDVDGDGFADVVSADSDGNSVSVILSDGRGLLRNAVNYPSGQFPLAIDLGDLDGDGDLDMVSSNYGSASFTLFRNRGDGTFERYRDHVADRAGSCAILHDRDNDGDLDITGVDELSDLLILFETESLSVGTVPARQLPSDPRIAVWPLPARSEATFSLSIPEPGAVTITVLNAAGQLVARPVDTVLESGDHSVKWTTAGLSSGVYLARVKGTFGTRSTTFVVRH